MAKVHITYSREDSDSAVRFADALRQLGHSVWIDQAVTGGQDWVREIQKSIRSSDAVVVFWSSEAASSEWVSREILYADGKGKLVIPVIIGSVFPSDDILLVNRQSIRGYHNSFQDTAKQIDDILKATFPNDTSALPLSVTPAGPNDYQVTEDEEQDLSIVPQTETLENISTENLEETLKVINAIQDTSQRDSALLQLVTDLSKAGQFDYAYQIVQGVELPLGRISGLIVVAVALARAGNDNQASIVYDAAFEAALDLSDPVEKDDTLSSLAGILAEEGKFSDARGVAKNILSVDRKMSSFVSIMEIAAAVGATEEARQTIQNITDPQVRASAERIFAIALASAPKETASQGPSSQELQSEEVTLPPPTQEIHLGSGLNMVNDNASGQEVLLGYKDYVDALSDLIESEHTQLPLTIGIYGSWGMGKSFLLNKLREELTRRLRERLYGTNPLWAARHLHHLGVEAWRAIVEIMHPFRRLGRRLRRLPSIQREGPRHIYIVPFNAWIYNANEIVWPGLVREIMTTLSKYRPWRHVQLIPRFFHNLMQQIRQNWMRLLLLILVTGLFIFLALNLTPLNLPAPLDFAAFLAVTAAWLKLVYEIGKVVYEAAATPLEWINGLFQREDYGRQIGYMKAVKEDLDLINRQLRDRARVLIVIDELDRCEPKKAVEVLQAIKLLLDIDVFIVCMAIDARIITGAVEKHYEDLLGPMGASGYEYLDKIVQIPFRIPIPNPDEVDDFVYRHMGKPRPRESSIPDMQPTGSIPTREDITRRPQPIPPTPTSSTAAAREKLNRLPEDFSYQEYQAFSDLAPFLRPNPRHLKRLINIYRLVRSLADKKGDPLILNHPNVTIRWLVMCGQWPYTINKMLCCYDDMKQREEAFPVNQDPLVYLLSRVTRQKSFSLKRQAELDYDPDLLNLLVSKKPDWLANQLGAEHIDRIRPYTVNFNPAVEAELEVNDGEDIPDGGSINGKILLP